MIGIALVIPVPLSVWFNKLISDLVKEIVPSCAISPVGPVLIGSSIVILLILAIVGWQIHGIMKTDPEAWGFDTITALRVENA